MPADPLGPAVFIAPSVSLLVTQGVGFLGALAFLLRLQGLDLPLDVCINFDIVSMAASMVAM